MRDFILFSSINHVTLFAWVKGRGKGHASMLNAQRVHEGPKKGHVISGQSLIYEVFAIAELLNKEIKYESL